MKPVSITDVAIKELSLIVPQHKGKEWEARNQDAQVLMVKGAEVEPKADEKKSIVLKALDTIKGYFQSDAAPFEPSPYPVTQATDNIDHDGDGPEDYNAIISAVCGLYNDLCSAYGIGDDGARSSAMVGAIDSFLAGLDAMRKGNDEKAGARHSKADSEHIAAIADLHAKMADHIAALQPSEEKAKSKKPYGDVAYADPENGKYPIDTEEHARAAWDYINKQKNADEYSADELKQVKDRIIAACKKFGIEISDGKAAPVSEEIDMTQEELDAKITEAATKAAEAAAAKTAEAMQAQIDAAKAEAQTSIEAANAAAEAAKAEAAEAKTAAQVQADLAEQYKAESKERGEVIKAAAGIAVRPTASSASGMGGESSLSRVLKAQLAQNPMSHQF